MPAPFGTSSHRIVIGESTVQTELYRTPKYDGTALSELTRLEITDVKMLTRKPAATKTAADTKKPAAKRKTRTAKRAVKKPTRKRAKGAAKRSRA